MTDFSKRPGTVSTPKARSAGSDVGPKAPRVLVIFNPVAGIRRKLQFEHVLDALEEKGCRVLTKPTGKRGDAEAFAAAITPDEVDVVVAAGGDGTINEVLNGLQGSPIPFGIIPLGTANVLAAEVGLMLDADHVAETIANGEPTDIYLGSVNDRVFITMAGAGFDAHVVAGVGSKLKRWLGKGAYVWRSLVELFAFPFGYYDVTIDGVNLRAASVVVCNAHFYGGTFTCAPDARLHDGTLHVCLFRKPGALSAMRYALGLGLGRLHTFDDVDVIVGQRVEVGGTRPEPIQGDGDILAQLPMTANLAKTKLRMMMPRGYHRSNNLQSQD